MLYYSIVKQIKEVENGKEKLRKTDGLLEQSRGF